MTALDATPQRTVSSLGGGVHTHYYDDAGNPIQRIDCPDHFYRDATTRYEVEWQDYTMSDDTDPQGAYHVSRGSWRIWDAINPGEPRWYHDELLGRFHGQRGAIAHVRAMAEGGDEEWIDEIDAQGGQ